MSVRRTDNSDEAALHLGNFAEYQRGLKAHSIGSGYDPDEGDHWRDGWINAAEIAQQKTNVLRHLPVIRTALMGAYRLIRNAPMPRKPLSYQQQQDRDQVLVQLNLAMAHIPAEALKDA